jgi:GMP synthase-like glutamine amidotransferase
MDLWDTEAHPWLVAEKQAIREMGGEPQPAYLGICLGLRLLAEHLAARGLGAAEVGIGRSHSMGWPPASDDGRD